MHKAGSPLACPALLLLVALATLGHVSPRGVARSRGLVTVACAAYWVALGHLLCVSCLTSDHAKLKNALRFVPYYIHRSGMRFLHGLLCLKTKAYNLVTP